MGEDLGVWLRNVVEDSIHPVELRIRALELLKELPVARPKEEVERIEKLRAWIERAANSLESLAHSPGVPMWKVGNTEQLMGFAHEGRRLAEGLGK